jgi:hypothetical protein
VKPSSGSYGKNEIVDDSLETPEVLQEAFFFFIFGERS